MRSALQLLVASLAFGCEFVASALDTSATEWLARLPGSIHHQSKRLIRRDDGVAGAGTMVHATESTFSDLAEDPRTLAQERAANMVSTRLHGINHAADANGNSSSPKGGQSSDLQLQEQAFAPEDALSPESCMLFDRYGEEYVKHHAGSVRCLQGGVPLFKTQSNPGSGETSLLNTGILRDYVVKFCDLGEFTSTQIQELCSPSCQGHPLCQRSCPCNCEKNFQGSDGNALTMANCLPTKEAFDEILTSATFINTGKSGHVDGVTYLFLDKVSDETVEAFVGNIDGANKGYKIEFAEWDHYLAQHEDNGVIDKDYPEKSWTCFLQKVADNIGGRGKISSWGLDRIDDAEGMDCRSQELDEGTLGEGVIVWILDTGILAAHEDFEGRATQTLDFTTSDDGEVVVCAESPNLKDCGIDRNGHGTHCAGTAAGKSYGVAKKATIKSAKVLGDQKDGKLTWIVGALDYIIEDFAATKKATPTIISMSLGGKGNSPTLRAAVDKAIEAGLVITVAAGNQGDDACKYNPAFVPDAITVAATNPKDGMPDFSNYGKCIDILAPGSAIKSSWFEDVTSVKDQSGTSMACPHVAGAAALIFSFNPAAHLKSKATQATVLKSLLEVATDGAISAKPDTPNKLLNVRKMKKFPDPVGMRNRIVLMFLCFVLFVIGVCIACTYFGAKKMKEQNMYGHSTRRHSTISGEESHEAIRKGHPEGESHEVIRKGHPEGKSHEVIRKGKSQEVIRKAPPDDSSDESIDQQPKQHADHAGHSDHGAQSKAPIDDQLSRPAGKAKTKPIDNRPPKAVSIEDQARSAGDDDP